jgi:hypothetical protein
MPDYTRDAETLFSGFADRHRLAYSVDHKAPVEVLWCFPVQARLSLPIWLGLQNEDELNFGVGSFYTSLFPFPDVAEHFASILDAWIESRARVIRAGPRKLVLEAYEGGEWAPIYSYHTLLPTFGRDPELLQNARADPSQEVG